MAKQKKILCFGEAVVDMFGDVEKGFVPRFGGASGNVAVGIKRLGGYPFFVGAVGQDFFGDFWVNALEKEEVGCHVLHLLDTFTTLGFVSLDEHGERSFCFHLGAHTCISPLDVNSLRWRDFSVLHFGSMLQAADMSARATDFLLKKAREHQIIRSYDPNYRPTLWDDEQEFLFRAAETLAKVDIVKLNQEELEIIAKGGKDLETRTKNLLKEFPNIQLLLVTLGKDGCHYHLASEGYQGSIKTIPVQTVDTTGAGDAFAATVLHYITPYIFKGRIVINHNELELIMRKATIAGSLVTTKHGAIEAFPTAAEIQRFLS